MKIEVGKKYRVGGNFRYTGNVIKITRKADLYGRADCYYEVVSDEDYMREYKEQWIEYEPMRYEMLKKYRPDCIICKKHEKEHGQPAQKKLF